jgi:uncharacterized protein (TIGR03118 family)
MIAVPPSWLSVKRGPTPPNYVNSTIRGASMKTNSVSLKTFLIASVAFTLSAAWAHASGPFDWENLQSDIAGVAEQTDPNVINPWGMAAGPNGAIWVNDNGAGVATVYNPDGTPVMNMGSPLVVQTGTTNPTGLVSNGTPFFKVTNGTNTLPSKFIFVGEDGIIAGYNPQLNKTQAYVARTNTGAVYKGATLGVAGGHNFLFITNFASGKVETWDENFNQVNPGGFVDPTLPSDYAPFGIRNFNNQIFVTYAKRNPMNPNDDLAGAGFGYIDIFTTSGTFVKRLVSQGKLNAPWGLSLIQGALWVGNFGDGRINVYNPSSGSFLGNPRDVFGAPLEFDGLWDLLFFNNQLYFSAGIADEDHGMFGVIFQ